MRQKKRLKPFLLCNLSVLIFVFLITFISRLEIYEYDIGNMMYDIKLLTNANIAIPDPSLPRGLQYHLTFFEKLYVYFCSDELLGIFCELRKFPIKCYYDGYLASDWSGGYIDVQPGLIQVMPLQFDKNFTQHVGDGFAPILWCDFFAAYDMEKREITPPDQAYNIKFYIMNLYRDRDYLGYVCQVETTQIIPNNNNIERKYANPAYENPEEIWEEAVQSWEQGKLYISSIW